MWFEFPTLKSQRLNYFKWIHIKNYKQDAQIQLVIFGSEKSWVYLDTKILEENLNLENFGYQSKTDREKLWFDKKKKSPY